MASTNKRNKRDTQTSIIFDREIYLEQEPDTPVAEDDTTPSNSDDWGMQFASFGSGSSGNCAYLGNGRQGILIDAGIDPDHVFDNLAQNGIRPEGIKGIVLTHDHADHIRYVYRILRKYKHIRVFCTPRLLNGMLRHHNISSRIKDYHVAVYKEIPFHISGMTLTAFDTSHDGADNMGFMIEGGGHKFVVATDMGFITPRADYYMRQAEYLMIESNYDRRMLDAGHYPEYLKNRVRSEKGHLDNVDAARYVGEICSKQLKYVLLCHLSKDNNTPEIALREMRQALNKAGLTVGDGSNSVETRDRDVQLYALPRFTTSTWFVF
ncbi:MAG: MBL fold metallo-hydrolase [Muribaculaceae bacterium]|nr:MBL fold metallo-hydrolase [Muribaculaceae bacterium]